MLFLAKTIGILILVSGVIFLINPKLMNPYIAFWEKGNRYYFGGVIRIVFGAILLFAASDSSIPVILVILGLLMLAGGIALFVMGLEKFQKIIVWWKKQTETFIRVWCGVVIAIGALIIYAV